MVIIHPGHLFVRLAGVSGAIAVTLGAYGAHVLKNKDGNEHNKQVFETASRYHFYHTFALLAMPLCNRPILAGSLMAIGMMIFCGTCYYQGLTGDSSLVRLTPWGGTILIISWLLMAI
ncbi:transmembrane protein 256 homolog [Antedon mediterranea]|uniref:transmembrane protein 256 homolog n=1 Tax=Antedon mediterranea TaxID=105859 RepID=UPI003AF9F14E